MQNIRLFEVNNNGEIIKILAKNLHEAIKTLQTLKPSKKYVGEMKITQKNTFLYKN